MLITPAQIRAARALLNLPESELATRAGISIDALRDVERKGEGEGLPAIGRVARVLEQAGVEFLPDGVRRRPPERPGRTVSFEELRAISLLGAGRAPGDPILTDADLYDEHGLPF